MKLKPRRVFTVKSGQDGAVWTHAGFAYMKKDGSMTIELSVLPLDGKLHVETPPLEDGEK